MMMDVTYSWLLFSRHRVQNSRYVGQCRAVLFPRRDIFTPTFVHLHFPLPPSLSQFGILSAECRVVLLRCDFRCIFFRVSVCVSVLGVENESTQFFVLWKVQITWSCQFLRQKHDEALLLRYTSLRYRVNFQFFFRFKLSLLRLHNLYTRCSDVTHVIAVTRRHVGGIILHEQKLSEMRKSDTSYAKVIAGRVLVFNSTRNSFQAHVRDVMLLLL